MKLKYEKQAHITTKIIISILMIILILILLIKPHNHYIYAIFFIVSVFIIFISYMIENIKFNEMKPSKDWKKQQGYIISCNKIFVAYNFWLEKSVKYDIRRSRYVYNIKVLSNEKIYTISGINNDKAYKKLQDMLIPTQSNEERNKFKIKKIPIDMYIKDDKYYADLESVEIS